MKRLVRPGVSASAVCQRRDETLAVLQGLADDQKGTGQDHRGPCDMPASSVTGLELISPCERDPAARVLLLSAVGAGPLPDGVG